MKIAYLVNQYPKVSHTFIRTEILALEEMGVSVERIAMRGWDAELVDPLDKQERKRTRYVLNGGAAAILAAIALAFLTRPTRFFQALATAWQLSRGGERGLVFHLIYLAEACLVLRWTLNDGVSHIHAHFGSNSTAVALLVRKLGCPAYSFTVHGPEEFDKPLQWKLREKIANAAFVVAITSFCRSQLYRWSDPKDWPKIRIVHCAINPSFASTDVAEPPTNDTFVCIGRLCEQKGQLVLVQAVAILKEQGIDVQVVFAGDGEMRRDVERAVASAGLQQQVSITGWVNSDQIRDLLEQSRSMVLPSFGEGLPVVIMEAMACKRPVITTYIAGIPELVRDGIEGLLVPASDADALANAMKEMLAMNAPELAAIGASARSRVLARHTAATEAGKLAQLIRNYSTSTSDD